MGGQRKTPVEQAQTLLIKASFTRFSSRSSSVRGLRDEDDDEEDERNDVKNDDEDEDEDEEDADEEDEDEDLALRYMRSNPLSAVW